MGGCCSQAPEGLVVGAANVTQAARAAVVAASTELGAALAGANLTMARSQQQDPEARHFARLLFLAVHMDFTSPDVACDHACA